MVTCDEHRFYLCFGSKVLKDKKYLLLLKFLVRLMSAKGVKDKNKAMRTIHFEGVNLKSV